MKTKLVKRHWCDFCNRAGLQAHAMAKHERHCTMNPARACRTCRLIDGGNGPDAEGLRALVALLPSPLAFNTPSAAACHCRECAMPWGDPKDGPCIDEGKKFDNDLTEAVKKLRKAAGGCPACMLAAVRQAGIPVPAVQGFNFKTEMAEVLRAHATEHMNAECY